MATTVSTVDPKVDEEKMTAFSDSLKEAVKEGVVEVIFHKSDGSIRTMKCTQNVSLIAEAIGERDPATPTKTVNYDRDKTCRVLDLEINEWRSFTFDRVISFKKL